MKNSTTTTNPTPAPFHTPEPDSIADSYLFEDAMQIYRNATVAVETIPEADEPERYRQAAATFDAGWAAVCAVVEAYAAVQVLKALDAALWKEKSWMQAEQAETDRTA